MSRGSDDTVIYHPDARPEARLHSDGRPAETTSRHSDSRLPGETNSQPPPTSQDGTSQQGTQPTAETPGLNRTADKTLTPGTGLQHPQPQPSTSAGPSGNSAPSLGPESHQQRPTGSGSERQDQHNPQTGGAMVHDLTATSDVYMSTPLTRPRASLSLHVGEPEDQQEPVAGMSMQHVEPPYSPVIHVSKGPNIKNKPKDDASDAELKQTIETLRKELENQKKESEKRRRDFEEQLRLIGTIDRYEATHGAPPAATRGNYSHPTTSDYPAEQPEFGQTHPTEGAYGQRSANNNSTRLIWPEDHLDSAPRRTHSTQRPRGTEHSGKHNSEDRKPYFTDQPGDRLSRDRRRYDVGRSGAGGDGDPSSSDSEEDRRSRRDTWRRDARGHRERRRVDYSSSSDQRDSDDGSWPNADSARGSYFNSRGVKLPPFTGKETWKVWYNRFRDVAKRKHWNDDEKLDELLPRLQGPAGDFVFEQLSKRTRSDYRKLVKELRSRFQKVETPKAYAGMFSRRDQKAGETAEEYAAELKRLYDKAHAERDPVTRQEDLLRRFLDGLIDEQARFQVEYVREPRNIDEAVFEVVTFSTFERKGKRPTRAVRGTDDEETNSDLSMAEDEEEERAARVPWQNGNRNPHHKFQRNQPFNRFRPNKPSRDADSSKPSNSSKDEISKLREEMMKMNTDMMKKLEMLEKVNTSSPDLNTQSVKQVVCFRCGRPGHYAKECPVNDVRQTESQSAPSANADTTQTN